MFEQCPKAVSTWVGVPQQLLVYIVSMLGVCHHYVWCAISYSWVLKSTIYSQPPLPDTHNDANYEAEENGSDSRANGKGKGSPRVQNNNNSQKEAPGDRQEDRAERPERSEGQSNRQRAGNSGRGRGKGKGDRDRTQYQKKDTARKDRKHSTQDEPTQDASVAAENDGAKVATGELPNCSPPTGADSPCAAVDEVQEAPPKAEVNSAGTMEMDAEIMRLREEVRLLRIDKEQSHRQMAAELNKKEVEIERRKAENKNILEQANPETMAILAVCSVLQALSKRCGGEVGRAAGKSEHTKRLP